MANPGVLHRYNNRLVAFEHTASPSNSSSEPTNIILWIGGLGDGLLTVRYPRVIAASLRPEWTLAEVLLSSAYKGWGTSSLKRDARELGECVKYFKENRPGKKVMLMGHSTGCQDIMEYLVGEGSSAREGVDGIILQGGVSDREGWVDMVEKNGWHDAFNETVTLAEKMVNDGNEREFLPREGSIVSKEFGAPVTAYRTHSLLSKGGDDDYFSSDLEDEVLKKTFGKIPSSTPVMFLLGSLDPYIPAQVSKEGLLTRWTEFVRGGGGIVDDTNGGIILGAHHNLNDDPESVVQDLSQRVNRFLKNLDGGLLPGGSHL